MIQARLQISGQINGRESLTGGLNTSIKEIKPELENLKVIPKTEAQKFKSEKYGYDEVIVERVTADIDSSIKPENIKEGETILGVPGGYKGIDTSDATAIASDILKDKTAYVNGKKIVGTYEGGNGDSTTDAEYIELEYIEATGEQYIDTGYIPNHDTSIDMSVNNVTSLDAPMISSSSKWQLSSFILTSSGNKYKWYYRNEIVMGEINSNNIDNIFLYRGYAKLNNVIVSSNDSVNNVLISDSTLRIFSGPIGGLDGVFASYRLQNLKISESGLVDNPTYIRDFIPVKKTATGEIGLYDKVNDVFYSNRGTGEFIAGPEKKINASVSSFTDTNTFAITTGIVTINELDLAYAKFMSQSFSGCTNLISIKNIKNTNNIESCRETFYNCSKLKELSEMDTSNVKNISYAFRNCKSLEILGGLLNLGKAYTEKTENYSDYRLDLSTSPLLTHESLMNVINGLYDLNLTYDVANGGTLYTQKIKLGSTNLAKLTAEEIRNSDSKAVGLLVNNKKGGNYNEIF